MLIQPDIWQEIKIKEVVNMEIKHINPENMAKPRGYSHAISIAGNHKTIYIGGQNAIDENGVLVGKNNLKQQTEQVLRNIEKILKSSEGNIENVVKFNIHILQGQNPQEGFQAFQEKWVAKEKEIVPESVRN
jgi:enamine deaminase RidA (YjgF/YER057c/UK114 family)